MEDPRIFSTAKMSRPTVPTYLPLLSWHVFSSLLKFGNQELQKGMSKSWLAIWKINLISNGELYTLLTLRTQEAYISPGRSALSWWSIPIQNKSLSIYLSIYPSIYLSTYLSIYLSISHACLLPREAYIYIYIYIYVHNTNECLANKVAKPNKVNPYLLHSNTSRPHYLTYITTQEGQEGAVLTWEWSWTWYNLWSSQICQGFR